MLEVGAQEDQAAGAALALGGGDAGLGALDLAFEGVFALLHKSLRHVRLSPMGQGASMRNDAESIHVPVPSTQLVRLQSGADRQGASDLLVQ